VFVDFVVVPVAAAAAGNFNNKTTKRKAATSTTIALHGVKGFNQSEQHNQKET